MNEYRKYWGGKIDSHLQLITISKICSQEKKEKIYFLYKELKRITSSGK